MKATLITCLLFVSVALGMFLMGSRPSMQISDNEAQEIRAGQGWLNDWCGYWYAGVECKNINGNGQYPNCSPGSTDPCDECTETYPGSAWKLWDGLKCYFDTLSCGKRLVGTCSGGICTSMSESGICPNPMQITLINCPGQ